MGICCEDRARCVRIRLGYGAVGIRLGLVFELGWASVHSGEGSL